MNEEKSDEELKLEEMHTALGGVPMPESQVVPKDPAGETSVEGVNKPVMCERDQRDLLQEGVAMPANAVEPPPPPAPPPPPPPPPPEPNPPARGN